LELFLLNNQERLQVSVADSSSRKSNTHYLH